MHQSKIGHIIYPSNELHAIDYGSEMKEICCQGQLIQNDKYRCDCLLLVG
jgi:hypothetical protein